MEALYYFFIKYKKQLRECSILLLYTISFFVLTYPLILYFNSGILGYQNSDAPIFLWNVWELNKNIFSNHTLFQTADLFFPKNTSLFLHTYTPVQSFLVLFIHAFVNNIVVSFNIIFLFSSVANAYFAFLFFRLLSKNNIAALLAGHFFGFQHLWAIYSLHGTQNILSIWYIPLSLYFYELYHQKKKNLFLLLCGGVLALAFINDFIIFASAGFVLMLYALVKTIFLQKEGLKSFIKQFCITTFSFAILAGWKIYLLHKNKTELSKVAIPTLEDVDFYHADFINLFRPSHFHAFWGNLSPLYRPVAFENGNAFIGFTSIIIILLFLIIFFFKKTIFQHTKLVIWFLILYLLTLSMATGPFFHFAGFNTHIPMPYFFLSKITPQILNLRMAARWLIPAAIFLAGILCFLLTYILNNLSKNKKIILSVVLYSILILDVLMWPKHILFAVPEKISGVYTAINKDTFGSVLEIPFGISSGYFTLGSDSKMNMLHQVIHRKPILGGHVSRLPFEYRDFYNREPVLKYLLNYQVKNPDKDDLASHSIQHFFETYKLTYIIFNKEEAKFEDEASQRLLVYFIKNLGFKLYFEDDQVLALKR